MATRDGPPKRRSEEARALRALPPRVIPNKKRRAEQLSEEVRKWLEDEASKFTVEDLDP